jgi:hypothetical protein
VFAAWHAKKRADREAKRAAELEERKKKVRGEGCGRRLRAYKRAHKLHTSCYAKQLATAASVYRCMLSLLLLHSESASEEFAGDAGNGRCSAAALQQQ